jgi:hypothetical protein
VKTLFSTLFLTTGFLLAAVMNTGCHTEASRQRAYQSEIVWHQPGKTQQEIQKDFGKCKTKAHDVDNPFAVINGAAMIGNAANYWGYVAACMESKGYTRCPRSEVPVGDAIIR